MPLNNHPSAKPTYDFYDTVNAGRTAIANGQLLSTTDTRPTASFPNGSTTFHWRSGAPVASYLVENSVGALRPDLASRVRRHPLLRGPGQLAEPRPQAGQPRR